MEEKKKNSYFTRAQIVLFIVAFTVIVAGSSYAFFTASITGNNSANSNVVTTGTMAVEFDDGTPNVTGEKLYPGQNLTKTFTVKNIGNVPAVYDIYLNNVVNTFVDDDLQCELISEDGANVAPTTCPELDSAFKSNIVIDVGQTHHYTFKVTFVNKDQSQDDNRNKEFQTSISPTRTYDSVVKTTSRVRVGGFSYNDNDKVYDDSYESLNQFTNMYNLYMKQNVTRVIATISNYYEYVEEFTSDYYTTVNDCYSDVNGDPNVVCYERNGKVYGKYTSDYFLNEDECKDEYYNYDSQTGEYTAPASEDNYGECKLVTNKTKQIVLQSEKENSNSEVCTYDNESEVCYSEWIDFSSASTESQSYDLEMAMYNKINAKKNFMCEVYAYSMSCYSQDNDILNFESQGLEVFKWNDYKYIDFNLRVKHNSIYECETADHGVSGGINKCIIENGEVYFYHSDKSVDGWTGQPYNTYSTLESCQDYCSSNGCYCLKQYYPGWQRQYNSCYLNSENSRCYEVRTM